MEVSFICLFHYYDANIGYFTVIAIHFDEKSLVIVKH